MQTAFVLKSADQSVTSNAVTPVDDNHLVRSVTAGQELLLEWHLLIEGASAGDINVAILAPTATEGWISISGLISTVTASPGNINTRVYTNAFDGSLLTAHGTITSVPLGLIVRAFVRVVNSGTVKLQWCQGTSSATATTVKAGSYLKETRLTTSTGTVAVIKAADESVGSDTLQDDDHLVLAVAANDLWELDYVLRCDGNGSAARDIVFEFGQPSGCAGMSHTEAVPTGVDTTGALTHIVQSDFPAGQWTAGLSATVNTLVMLHAFVQVGGTGGNIVLRWAQNSNGTPDTSVLKDSLLLASRILPVAPEPPAPSGFNALLVMP